MFSLFLYYNISQDSNTTRTFTCIVWIYWIEVIHLYVLSKIDTVHSIDLKNTHFYEHQYRTGMHANCFGEELSK